VPVKEAPKSTGKRNKIPKPMKNRPYNLFVILAPLLILNKLEQKYLSEKEFQKSK
jgi:hypothetical protein